MLKLKSNMKDIQPRTLRFHMPFTNAAKVLGEAAGAAHAGTALPISAGLEPAEPVQALKRPLPFDSRAALLQDPPRRPKVIQSSGFLVLLVDVCLQPAGNSQGGD